MDARGSTSGGGGASGARRPQDALAREHARLRAVMDGMLDPVLLVGLDGIVRRANRAVEGVFGWTPDEIVGRNVSVLMPEPHRSEHDGYLERYRRTGETWILNTTRRFEVLRKDGRAIVCELSVSRIDVPGEDEPLLCGSFRDVTERKRAEEALAASERRFHAVFDQEFQYVALLGHDGTTLEVNRTALERTGVERGRVVGRPFWEAPWWRRSTEDRERVRAAVERAARGELVRFETERRAADGAPESIDFSMKPIVGDDGTVSMLIAEGRDVTAIKQAQRRETSMLRALATIGESASALAHEIKNPITAVNIALRAVADQLGAEHSSILEDLAGRMQKLEQRIRRTLSFTRPLDLRLVPCAPGALLVEAVGTLQPLADERGVRLVVDAAPGAPEVEADPMLIEEVLVNLIRNAIEALEGGGLVTVASRPSGAGVTLEVADDGPGIAQSMLGRLFRPFETSKAEGTGLGLALCRKIVEEHGGTMEAANRPEGGAVFRVALPARA